MFSTVQKGDLQCTAHCARLTPLEFVEEFFEWQVLARSQKLPHALREGNHYCSVILSPPLRVHENDVDSAWELLKKLRYLAGHLTNTRRNKYRSVRRYSSRTPLTTRSSHSDLG